MEKKKLVLKEKLIGKNKKNCAVFISGRGSNLKSLINFSKNKSSPIKIVLVVSNNIKAKGLIYAKKNDIEYMIVNFSKTNKAESKILKKLKKNKIDLICLAGFMKILSKKFIKIFDKKIINVHPSLLPKFKGLNTHERVLLNKEKYTGCTIHFVNHKLDSGKIILQKKINVLKNDTVKKLKKKVLKIEHKLYPEAIKKIYSNL